MSRELSGLLVTLGLRSGGWCFLHGFAMQLIFLGSPCTAETKSYEIFFLTDQKALMNALSTEWASAFHIWVCMSGPWTRWHGSQPVVSGAQGSKGFGAGLLAGHRRLEQWHQPSWHLWHLRYILPNNKRMNIFFKTFAKRDYSLGHKLS